jgi:hypothetical protein
VIAVSEPGSDRSDPVLEALDKLDRLDSTHDPTVAIFDHHEDQPVIAKVGDELRMLSNALIYAREIDVEDVRKAWDEHGEPRLDPIHTQAHRFGASDFREVADLE